MTLTEAIRSRRMVRAYDSERPVPPPVLARILDNAIRAPSAGYSQGWDFVVLRTAAQREVFWAATTDPSAPADGWLRGMRTAPVLVVCVSNPAAYGARYAEDDKTPGSPANPRDNRRAVDRDPNHWPIPYWDVDTGMAALLMLLTATEAGLGGCFFAVPPAAHDATRQALAIPAGRRLVAVVSLGYPAPASQPVSRTRGRRPLAAVAHEGRFGQPLAIGDAAPA
jgi:nitroreductase